MTVDECVDLDFQAVSDQQETDPGGFLCLNDDDDNSNGVPDKDEPGATPGENDLIALTVSIAPALTGTVTLSAIAGATRTKLYENADRSTPVTLPKSWTVPTPELPKTFYVEGIAVSATAQDVEFKAMFTGNGGPCEDRVKLTVLNVEITTPNGDPTTTAGANPTNERTYSTVANPTVTVPCVAASVPDPSMLRWTIEDVGGTQATWSPSVPGDVHIGTGLSPTATYTGMPPNYNDFGPKTITLTMAGESGCEDTQVVEVFWPLLLDPAGARNDANFAKNHPGGDLAAAATDTGGTRGASTRAPNWFYYWREAPAAPAEHALYDSTDVAFGETPAVFSFARVGSGGPYRAPHQRILIEPLAPGTDTTGGTTTGIDAFRDTVEHENSHAIDQSVNYTNEAFGTAISGATDVAAAHWSFTIAKGAAGYNHYLDINGDSDNNDTVDLNDDGDTNDRVLESAIAAAAGGPRDVNGDGDQTDLIYEKEDLDADGDSVPDWHDGPGVGIESLAEGAEPNAEHARGALDWGDPGKQHKTINKYDD